MLDCDGEWGNIHIGVSKARTASDANRFGQTSRRWQTRYDPCGDWLSIQPLSRFPIRLPGAVPFRSGFDNNIKILAQLFCIVGIVLQNRAQELPRDVCS